MTMYAIAVEKYDLSSLCARARMLFMRHLRRDSRRGRLIGRDVQEDFFEAHAERAHFEEAPPTADDGRGKLAAHVASGLAVNLVADDLLLGLRHGYPCDARHVLQHGCRVGTLGVHLQIHRL